MLFCLQVHEDCSLGCSGRLALLSLSRCFSQHGWFASVSSLFDTTQAVWTMLAAALAAATSVSAERGDDQWKESENSFFFGRPFPCSVHWWLLHPYNGRSADIHLLIASTRCSGYQGCSAKFIVSVIALYRHVLYAHKSGTRRRKVFLELV